jgi:hypothetical protein
MFNEHLGEIDSAEPTGRGCPICESPILKVVQNGQTWIACECIAVEEDAAMKYSEGDDFIFFSTWLEEMPPLAISEALAEEIIRRSSSPPGFHAWSD